MEFPRIEYSLLKKFIELVCILSGLLKFVLYYQQVVTYQLICDLHGISLGLGMFRLIYNNYEERHFNKFISFLITPTLHN